MKYAIMSHGQIVEIFSTRIAAEYFLKLQFDNGLNISKYEIVELE